MNDYVGWYIAAVVVLVLFSGYFSATETAFSSLSKTKLRTMAEKGNKRASLALSVSEEYDKLISTILIGNNIVNIALASIVTVMFMEIWQVRNGAAVATAVSTVVVLIFGEISPKSIAKDIPEKFAMLSAPFIRLLTWILMPVSFIFSQWKKLLSKVLRIEEDTKMSQEELLMFVEEVQQEGSIDSDGGDLLRNAIEFTELEAKDILTHRVDLEAVPITATKQEIAELFSTTQFSRILIYEENIDNIIGIIHLKDFFTANGITDKAVTEIMTKPLFVQQSENVNELLKILQTNKSHIAVIIDEYGGTLGIVTMEDILEELVGEIWDEHDEIIEDFKKISDNTYQVDGSLSLDDFCDFFDIEYETDIVSVGGWAMEQMGKIPENGESFEFENLHVTITQTDSHRVTQITVLQKETENAENEKTEDAEDN